MVRDVGEQTKGAGVSIGPVIVFICVFEAVTERSEVKTIEKVSKIFKLKINFMLYSFFCTFVQKIFVRILKIDRKSEFCFSIFFER